MPQHFGQEIAADFAVVKTGCPAEKCQAKRSQKMEGYPMTERAVDPLANADVNERIVAIIREHIEPLFGAEVFVTVMVRDQNGEQDDALSIVTDDPEMDGIFGIEMAPEGMPLH